MLKDNNGLPDFNGPFKELIPEYILYRRAQGYVIGDPIVYRLRELDIYAGSQGITGPVITRRLYEGFTSCRPGEKPGNVQKRQSAVRGFAKYLVQRGYRDIYTGYDDMRRFKSDFIPYVFSMEEIERMFHALETGCRKSVPAENDMFRAAMLLYYCCGLRKSEAQSLKVRDVDLDSGKITIWNSKNDVSRIVVASETLLTALRDYADRYLKTASDDSFFLFPGYSRTKTEDLIYREYRSLLASADIPVRPDGKRQRLHDLRHTFCVRALEQMQDKGFDLYTSLPLLSRYLGHKHITETEYYLRLLDEHFDGILSKCNSYSPDLYACGREENENGKR